jgi:late competence protein required for DNA uptake (superfamily II DNA/RNA helicase)
VSYLEVVIYKAKGRDGYFYDMSLNPDIDFAVLKNTRNVTNLEVITPEIGMEKAESILKSIYSSSSIFGKLIYSQDFLINKTLKKLGISRIKQSITENYVLPNVETILKVEDIIKGKVINLEMLTSRKKDMALSFREVIDIVQVLYCQRRIRMVSSCGYKKDKQVCSFCGKQSCECCPLGFSKEDILLYAAYNYSNSNQVYVDHKLRKLQESHKEAYDGLVNFIKSKRTSAILWCAPNSFEYDVLSGGVIEVIKNGGKALIVTSSSMVYEIKESLKSIIKGPEIDNTDGYFPDFKKLDISICSYNDYPCFHKAFDLVILDERYSFIDRPITNILFVCQRAVKEKGKFLNITCSPEKGRKSIFKASPEIISLPVAYARNPIPEPRIVTSRYLKGAEAFIPPMASDVIKWSLGEGARVIIFVPDERGVHMVYYYLTSLEGIDKELIDISEESNKVPMMSFMKRESQILVSRDFRDAVNTIEDVNVIVMYSDNDVYKVDTLVYMASMAVAHVKNNLREVVFVASSETETLSLAKSTIRSINKMAWEKGYLKG